MTTYLVLTVIGDDKPGLVESLSQAIADNSGNWLESSMSELAGKFAGILKISIADSAVDNLIEELNGLSDRLNIVIEKATEETRSESPQCISLNMVGNDRPGIVKEISRVLASLDVNVEALTTECSPAPMSGASLFTADAKLKVPTNMELESLRSHLEQLSDDLVVEIKVS